MIERTERDERFLKIFQFLVSIINLNVWVTKGLTNVIDFYNIHNKEIVEKYGESFMVESVEFLAKELDWDIHIEKKEEVKSE